MTRPNQGLSSLAPGGGKMRDSGNEVAYFTAPRSYYATRVFTTTHYKDLPKLHPRKAHKLNQVNEMRNWRAMYGQSIPQKTVRNMTTKDNLGTPPNICTQPTLRLHSLQSDFTVLSEAAAVSVPNRETTETLYIIQARLSLLKLIPVILINCNQ